MSTVLRPAAVIFLALSIITGILYPLLITAVAQVAFPFQANGSIIMEGDSAIGSALIGQEFSDPANFWGRLSATGPVPYSAFHAATLTGSSGSNLAQSNPQTVVNAKARIDALRSAETSVGLERSPRPIPVDLITASGSGLDPHISEAAAEYQVARVAKARGLTEESVRFLVQAHTRGRRWGIMGEPVVDVRALNRALPASPHE
ncbi:MAG: potassium-transporting ATPase subunit KdpC [Phycisphaerae bacterium]|nr:potassium-transporting ATPase subunit KdpC [Phycisphaerae bacterium]